MEKETPDFDEDRWVCSPEEARQVLGYGKNQMYEALKTGKVEAIRDNARYRVLVKPLMKKVRGTAA